MLSVSSSSSAPILGWPLEEAMYDYSMNHGFYDHITEKTPAETVNINRFASGGDQAEGRNCGDAKKVNHNASERHRRKKINELYSSLRSLLPASEQSRRMSIPTTVARVLKYIPELQEEVERKEKKRLAMSKKIIKNQESVTSLSPEVKKRPGNFNEEAKGNIIQENINKSNVSISKVGDKDEVLIQISTLGMSVAEILISLEEDGYQLIGASSFQSSGRRLFVNLHLQNLFGAARTDFEGLSEKLLSMLQNRR